MLYESAYFAKDIVIAIFLFVIFLLYRQTQSLRTSLGQEKYKRSMPLVSMELSATSDDYSISMLNESYCYAKNIQPEDLDIVFDYGFKKHLTMTFSPIEVLKPGAKTKLAYRILDKDYDITERDYKTIFGQIVNFPITLNLRYENIEGDPFVATIAPDKGQYILKEVRPLNE